MQDDCNSSQAESESIEIHAEFCCVKQEQYLTPWSIIGDSAIKPEGCDELLPAPCVYHRRRKHTKGTKSKIVDPIAGARIRAYKKTVGLQIEQTEPARWPITSGRNLAICIARVAEQMRCYSGTNRNSELKSQVHSTA